MRPSLSSRFPWTRPVAAWLVLCSTVPGVAWAQDAPPPPPPPAVDDSPPPPAPVPVSPVPETPVPVAPAPAPPAVEAPREATPVQVDVQRPVPPKPVETPAPGVPPPTPPKKKDCPPWICKDVDPFDKDRNSGTASMAQSGKGEAGAGQKPKRFIEGELANVGAIGLVPWENQVGLVLGIERIGAVYFAAITPQINYNTEVADQPLDMSFGVPVRLQLLDTRPDGGWTHAGRLRKQDWDEASDFAQIIRNITYGGKEGHVYVDVNAFKSSSLGHGTILKRYNPNLNLNSRQVSGEIDAFGDYGGGELYVNNVVGPNVIGGLLFAKPLSFVDKSSYVMRSFSLGATVVADIDAPLRNRLDYSDLDNDGARERVIAVDQNTFQPLFKSTQVVAYGFDTEVKLVDTKTTDWKTYLDYSMLASGLPTDDPKALNLGDIPTKYVNSGGLTWGNLVRLNLGEDTIHALRLRAELRRYDPNYLPSYFDVMYEIQRLQYRLAAPTGSSASRQQQMVNGTKLQSILGRNPDGSKVLGMYFEASWKIAELFAMAVGLEVNDSTPDNNLFVHLELPRYKNFQFLATLHRRSSASAGDLFDFKPTNRDILIVKGRYRVADSFHINMEAITPYGIGPDSFFQNTIDFNVNAEFGFGYGSKK